MATPVTRQYAYRFRADDNSDPDQCTALAAQDTSISRGTDVANRFMVCFGIENDNTAVHNAQLQLEYQYDGGAWADVNGSATYVRPTDGTPTDSDVLNANILTGFTGGYTEQTNGEYDDVDGITDAQQIGKQSYVNVQFCVYITTSAAAGKTINLRVKGVNTYSQTATLSTIQQLTLTAEAGSVAISGTAATLTRQLKLTGYIDTADSNDYVKFVGHVRIGGNFFSVNVGFELVTPFLYGNIGVTATRDNAQAKHGTWSLGWVHGSTGSGYGVSLREGPISGGTYHGTCIGITPSTSYRITFWYYGTGAAVGKQMRLEWWWQSLDGASYQQDNDTAFTIQEGWQQIVSERTSPASSIYTTLQPRIVSVTSDVSWSSWIDSIEAYPTATETKLIFSWAALTADAGSVTISGTDATLTWSNRTLACDAGSVAINGTDATLTQHYYLSAEAGSVVITGTDATLTSDAGGDTPMAADPGAFVITGTAATLAQHYLFACDAGSFAISGTDATLTWAITAFNDVRQSIINGLANTVGTEWDLEKVNIPVTDVVRTSDTVVTITLSALAGFDIATLETVQATVPGIARVGTPGFGRSDVVATPTFNIDVNVVLTADVGSVLISGTAATLTRQYYLAADAGSVIITGTDATLTEAGGDTTLTAEAGSVVITGTAATLTQHYYLAADPGSYSINGTAASLEYEHYIAADSGSIVITGTIAVLTVGKLIDANAGSYLITGADATLSRTRAIVADAGSVIITGTAATLEKSGAAVLAADPGSFVITGTDAVLGFGYYMAADAGSVVITGTATGSLFDAIKLNILLDSDQAEANGWDAVVKGNIPPANIVRTSDTIVTITLPAFASFDISALETITATVPTDILVANLGADATPTFDISPNLVLTAEAGTVVITGTDALLGKYVLDAQAGSVVVTGTDATLIEDVLVSATWGQVVITGTDAFLYRNAIAGSFVITGIDATLTYDAGNPILVADAGSVAINGTDATLTVQYNAIAADPGSIVVSGTDASLLVAHYLSAEAGSVAISGIDAALSRAKYVAADAGSVVITGTAASLLQHYYLSAGAGSVIITGTDAALSPSGAAQIIAESGSYVISGTAALLAYNRAVIADSGTVVVTGTDATFLLDLVFPVGTGVVVITGTDVDVAAGIRVKAGVTPIGSVTAANPGLSSLLKFAQRPDSGVLYRYDKFFLYNNHAYTIPAGATLTVDDSDYALHVESAQLTYADRITPGAQAYATTVVLPELTQGSYVGVWVRRKTTRSFVNDVCNVTLVAGGFDDYTFTLPIAAMSTTFHQHAAKRIASFTDDTPNTPVYTES